jgi:hypothetical protein
LGAFEISDRSRQCNRFFGKAARKNSGTEGVESPFPAKPVEKIRPEEESNGSALGLLISV